MKHTSQGKWTDSHSSDTLAAFDSLDISAVVRHVALDCVLMVSVFDECNTLEGEVLAFGKISITFEDGSGIKRPSNLGASII